MTEYKIEKNIELPLKGTDRKYPFEEMEIGDSFAVPTKQENKFTVRAAAYAYGRNHQKSFRTRTEDDGGVRIWRTE